MRRTYSTETKLNKQNAKVKGTNIISTDTVRGCANKCESCWARKNTRRSIEKFEIPVKVEKFIGRVNGDAWYRFGNQGDPGTDWKHSEKVVNDLKLKNFFGVTKLVTLKGFTGVFTNLQISVDPLNIIHFANTLKNIEILRKDFPQVKMVLRVRSCSTLDPEIQWMQESIVKFANTYGLPIMETRMRFDRKDSIQRYNLNPEDYFMSKGKQTKPVWGKKFLEGADKYYDCDLHGKKCLNCENCTSTWTNEQFSQEGEFIAPPGEEKDCPIPMEQAA